MSYQKIIVEREDGVVIIKMNNPDRMNAIDDQMAQELDDELSRTEADPESRVIVLTGVGRAFGTGYDMKAMVAEGRHGLPSVEAERYQSRIDPSLKRVRLCVQRFTDFDKPMIAAVNGYAVGGGLGMALACDVRIASEDARFSFMFTKRGLSPADGSSYLLPYAVGMSKALELAFTGDMIDGKEAERIGLVSKVVPPDQLMPETLELARKIAKGPPVAIALTRYVMHRAFQMDIVQGMMLSQMAHRTSINTEDHVEGVKAYAEKRDPIFKGR